MTETADGCPDRGAVGAEGASSFGSRTSTLLVTSGTASLALAADGIELAACPLAVAAAEQVVAVVEHDEGRR